MKSYPSSNKSDVNPDEKSFYREKYISKRFIITSGCIVGCIILFVLLFGLKHHSKGDGRRITFSNQHSIATVTHQNLIVTSDNPTPGILSDDKPSTSSGKLANKTKVNYSTKPSFRGLRIPGREMISDVFTPGQEKNIHLKGATLTVPSGASPKAIPLSITGLLAEDLPPIPGEITNVTRDFPGFRFLPHGMLFDSMATISMAYDETLIPEGYTTDDIYTYYFNEQEHKWMALERDSIATGSKSVVSSTMHFTDMINGIIKVPESPQTAGYTPTSIKDIKAADPAAGIVQIAPPSASGDGSCAISFPFKVPSGRAGMQPQAGLQYSSSGGSGWTGFGWSLSTPSISVDASFGVPHYLNDKESETYLMGGAELTPVAHRSEYIARTAEKRFYPRIEGAFSKIIRHGDNPTNYWWEVTAKNGMRSFYGGTPGAGVAANATLTDAKGNIAFWALTQTRDVHDNFIVYSYDKTSDKGVQLYPKTMIYTGHGSENGVYSVTFLREDPANTFERKDIRIDARHGFVERDADLLRRIDVAYGSELIRSYTLQYATGAFLKTMLQSVSELDADGKIFYTHTFDYYDDVQSDKGYVPFAAEKKIAIPDDNVKNAFLNPFNMFFDNVSALGASSSAGVSGGVAVTVGYNDFKLWKKTLTAGGNVSFSSSKGEGLLAMADINGDGLPDKIFKKDDNLYYRPNILTSDGTPLFGEARPISGVNNFSKSKTRGFGFGFEANPPFSFVGYTHNKSTSKTSIYFSDFNADGLIDIANDGVVYFNHINDQGDPVFSISSDLTPSPILASSSLDPSLFPDPAIEQAELSAKFPLHDAVRIWKAPYTGTIVLNAPVSLQEDTSAVAKAYTLKDGVKVSIQVSGTVKWITDIGPNDYTVKTPSIPSFAITKGQKIYFRVQSQADGAYDQVKWDPEINYTYIQGNDTLYKWVDNNGKKIARYKASEDFLLSGRQSVGMPKDGKIRIKTAFSKPVTSDSVTMEIIRMDTLGHEFPVASRGYSSNQQLLNDSLIMDLAVTKTDIFLVRVTALTSIDWSRIQCNPYLEYIQINDGTPVTGADGTPSLSFQIVPDYTVLYNNPLHHAQPLLVDSAFVKSLGINVVDNLPHTLKITPVLETPLLPVMVRDTFLLAVKTKNKLYGEKQFQLTGTAITPADTLKLNVQLGDSLYFEYYFKQYNQAITITRDSVKLQTVSPVSFDASLFSCANPNDQDEIFGPLYRGWGQFDYDGNPDRTNVAIDETLLKLSTQKNEDVSSAQDTADLNGMHDPMGDVFSVMIPFASRNQFLGTDEQVYVSGDRMSSSRRGEKSILVEKEALSTSGLTSVTKISTDISQGASAGGSVGPVSGSASHSWGSGNIIQDMMDMNGDHYPDVLTSNKIQYSGVLGNISGAVITHGLGDHFSKSDANGVTLGGSYVSAKANNTMTILTTKKMSIGMGDPFQNATNADGSQETAKSSIGISGNFATNTDYTDQTWMDINGDGLPDKVYKNGTVCLNLGYSFAAAEQWNFEAIREGKSIDYGGGIGVNYSNKSITAGLSVSKTENEATEAFMDVNGDGLPDMVKGNQVMLNTGAGFADAVTWDGLGALDGGSSFGEAANVGFTVGITFVIIPIKLCINPSGSVSRGVSRTNTQLSDIDGDGWPDFLSSGKEGELYIKHSTIGRTNKLKTVYRPLGSNFSLDYARTPASYNNPNGEWTLSSVKAFDGFKGDGVDSSMVTFEYSDGYYDRHERQFYGFANVKTHFHNTGNKGDIYRTSEEVFDNQSYYTKGVLLSETLFNNEGARQTGSENKYVLRNIHSGVLLDESFAKNDSVSAFVSLEETHQFVYEGSVIPQLSTRVTFSYDLYGNISGYIDYSSGKEKDKVSISIGYHHNEAKYIHAIPSQQEVFTTDGLMRHRETTINALGDITNIIQKINNSETAQHDMEYDEYGNLTKITNPANSKGERMWHSYAFDSVTHALVTKVSDAYGYSSFTKYDFMREVPIQTTDMNNVLMRFTFDHQGRMQTVTGPREILSSKPYTIAFNYFPEAIVPYAQTLHYDSVFNSNIETYTFVDGMGRPVQVKKTAALFQSEGSEDKLGFMISGKIIYDAFGRVTKSYQPMFEESSEANKINLSQDPVKPIVTTYDVLDRKRTVRLSDGTVTSLGYGFTTYQNEVVHTDTLTDALGHQAVNFTNVKGQKTRSILKTSGGDITSSFTYNALNELLAVTDPNGNQTLSVFDMAGRRISVNQPDAGLTEFKYDAAGLLISKTTANLRKTIPNGGAIIYKYDYERLSEVNYPKNIQNKVQYAYGAPGALNNRAGRITLVQDASGGQEFFYGSMGEIVKTIRTIQLGEADMRTWIWSSSYDSWNRMQTMTYPDGEKVSYHYNRAGNLTSMDGNKLGRSYDYINRIGYDKYEKQVYLRYGNGTITTYSYEPERLRMARMSLTTGNKLLMDNLYSYDALNNILGITNSAAVNGDIGGSSAHTYTYDDLNRLSQASGKFIGKKDSCRYMLAMQYNNMGSILQKSQTNTTNGKTQSGTTYNLAYKYEGRQPNSASQIGDRTFTYDENGNLTFWEDSTHSSFRQMQWDEENRLMLISDNGYLNHYVYDASGERVVKSYGGTQGVYINGAPAGIINHTDNNYTVYVSPYFVFQNNKFTKHFIAGSNRVTSKIGNGQFENQYRPGVFEITAGGVNYIHRQRQLAASKIDNLKTLGLPPGPPTMKGIYGEPEYTGTALPDIATDSIAPAGWPKKPVFAPAGGPPGAPIQWGDDVTNATVDAGFGYVGNGNVEEDLRYFYHSDHLGSTSYITDDRGEVTQFVGYLPSGETFVEQHAAFDSPYKFNGKEFDGETGLYYYGARFYDPKTSVWNSVDPMAENFTMWNPYNYCMGNPIKLIDPNGMAPTPEEAAAMSAHVYGDKTDNILIGGWKVSNRTIPEAKYNNSKNGLKSALYERTKANEKTEYCYVTAGTEDGTDIYHDVVQPAGISGQYTQAKNNANFIAKALGKGTELTFSGHSLGGGEAAANAYSTGKNAITFNAAGESAISMARYGISLKSKIDAYIMLSDPLNLIQNNTPVMPDVDGTRHYVRPVDGASWYNGHSMDNMLKVFGINPSLYAIPIPPTPYDPNIIHNVGDAKRELSRWTNWNGL